MHPSWLRDALIGADLNWCSWLFYRCSRLMFIAVLLIVQNEDASKVEYRVWNPFRSKLAAAVLGGVDNIWIVSPFCASACILDCLNTLFCQGCNSDWNHCCSSWLCGSWFRLLEHVCCTSELPLEQPCLMCLTLLDRWDLVAISFVYFKWMLLNVSCLNEVLSLCRLGWCMPLSSLTGVVGILSTWPRRGPMSSPSLRMLGTRQSNGCWSAWLKLYQIKVSCFPCSPLSLCLLAASGAKLGFFCS